MKLVILDRDGVINIDSDQYIKSSEEWIPIPGSIDAIAKLSHAGYIICVATNQSGISRGYFDITTLNKMHEKMHKEVEAAGGHIDGVFFCPHLPEDHCHCRKPLPGLLLQISKRFSVSLEEAFFIGDSQKDIEAAKLAGAKPILVRTGKGQITEQKLPDFFDDNILIFDHLSDAATHIIINETN